jgi:dipeptidyl aminopeptidase/acylaminoacyl peptidase
MRAAPLAFLLGSGLLGPGLLLATAAQATYPGTNGAIVYTEPEGGPPVPRHIESVYLGPEGRTIPDKANLRATAVDTGGEAFDPSWSADGRSLAFASTRSGHKQVYSVQFDFARNLVAPCVVEPCRLTNDSAEDYDPAWSPDGQSIVFTSTRSGTPQIYKMSTNGGEATRLTFDNAIDQQASWSSAGRIAFVSNQTGTGQLYTMNANGGELRQITSLSTGATDPSWSPDGTKIAFASGAVGSYQVYVTELAGGTPRRLTYFAADNKFPQWSPDGTKLLITHGPALSGATYLEAIDARTGELAPGFIAYGGDGNWAPLPSVPSGAPSSAPSATVPGASAVATPLSGKVTVTPGHLVAPVVESASPLSGRAAVPVNSTYNATQGVVGLAVARSSVAVQTTSTAVVTGGTFSVSQRGPVAVATIRLIAPRPSGCFGEIARAAGSHPLGRGVRGHTKGNWHLAGGSGKGSVGGDPRWEIRETCRGTVYRAFTGVLIVTDPHRHRRIRVTAGHQYLVRFGPR